MSYQPGTAAWAQPQPNAFAPPPIPRTHDEKIDYGKQYLTYIKALTFDIAKGYHVLGHQYHFLPLRLRYEDAAKEIRTDASYNFTVSTNRELPGMITMIGTIEMLIQQVDALFAEPAQSVDLEKIRLKFAILEAQVSEAMVLVARLGTMMRVYCEVVIPREILLGRDLYRVKVDNEERKERMLQKWVAALPEVCFGRYLEVRVEDEEQNREQGGGDELDEEQSDGECEFVLE